MVSENQLHLSLKNCNAIYKLYEELLNSYVTDFYVENHWTRLPLSLRQYLEKLTMEDIANLLNVYVHDDQKLYPLSLISLRQLIASNSIARNLSTGACLKNKDKFFKTLWRGVKLKKRHEIELMSELCYECALKTNCNFIIDVGSGLGHLSRVLCYRFGLNICTFEADVTLSKMAGEYDAKFVKELKIECNKSPIHINKRIEPDIDITDFLDNLRRLFQIDSGVNFKFGIVGLHPCGNLATTLVKLFNKCKNAVFINIASCCYMKLTLKPLIGFPLSDYCIENNFSLDYITCEIACHAIEKYIKKLNSNDAFSLKIHAYRAALEAIIRTINPDLKHIPVSNIKCDKNLDFKSYCNLALKRNKFNIVLNITDIEKYDDIVNRTWKNVVYFYSLRLMMAPLIETIILYDRLLFINKASSNCNVLSLFDSNISPRSHVLIATRKSM